MTFHRTGTKLPHEIEVVRTGQGDSVGGGPRPGAAVRGRPGEPVSSGRPGRRTRSGDSSWGGRRPGRARALRTGRLPWAERNVARIGTRHHRRWPCQNPPPPDPRAIRPAHFGIHDALELVEVPPLPDPRRHPSVPHESIQAIRLSKRRAPSAPPSAASKARSGCGISAATFPGGPGLRRCGSGTRSDSLPRPDARARRSSERSPGPRPRARPAPRRRDGSSPGRGPPGGGASPPSASAAVSGEPRSSARTHTSRHT